MLDKLNEIEIRVLGVLIEKSKTTPEYYPLTLNALITACNQKTSRNPVMQLAEEEVIEALDSLKKKQLIAHVIGASGSRALKYRHTLAVKHPLDPAEISVLCLLFLRGPLTSGEINSNSSRLFEFDSLQEVQETIEQLKNYTPPFVLTLERKPGQKEDRHFHCFTDEIPLISESNHYEDSTKNEKILALETKVQELSEKIEKIYRELGLE
ncbi:MAG: YceH family protein [Flavobacteriia bacterium]|nr:YceH family protein [Flavobacteriia bacterium]